MQSGISREAIGFNRETTLTFFAFVFEKSVLRACVQSAANYTPRAMLNLSSLNPQQRQAVETIRGPVLILAGAGTGKTRVITYRIAHMVAPGHCAGAHPRRDVHQQGRARNAGARPQAAAQAQDAGRQKAGRGPTICTFHSLCVRILRQHIEKLGYKRNFVIYDESEQLGAVKKILSAHFRQRREDRSRRRAGDVEQVQERRRTRGGVCRSEASARWPSMSASATNPPCTPATRWISTI